MDVTGKRGNCWNCGNELTPLDYGRQDSCRKCGKDTKVCKNCEFHDRSSNNECRETQADRVVDKEKANFCDYFVPKAGGGGNAPSRDALKAAADALFNFGKKD
jgi:hypothetical protein